MQNQVPDLEGDQSLTDEESFDVVDLALRAGQLLLQYGSETEKIEDAVFRLCTSLGCDISNLLVSHNAIMITVISGGKFRTKIQRVVRQTPNFDIVTEVTKLARQVEKNPIDRHAIREKLDAFESKKIDYARWQIIAMTALGCAAISRLFGGDWIAFVITFLAGGTAMFVRQQMVKIKYNLLVITGATAFVATMVASLAIWFSSTPQIALASSVLLLAPSVPLINSVKDLIKGYLVIGWSSFLLGVLVSIATAIGILISISITGMDRL